MGCNCGKPKCKGQCGCKSPAVLQINNPSNYITFHKVNVPAAMGDSTTNPPAVGKYKNVLLYYEADQTSWLYSTDGIPTNVTGHIGPVGPQGPAGTIEIGTTTTGATGEDASVENVGTPENAILNFVIPRGEQGEQGIQGETGPQGYMNEQDVIDVLDNIIPEGFFTGEAIDSGCGDNVVLLEMAGDKPRTLQIAGNTAQQTYTGKNVCDTYGMAESTNSGLTLAIENDGTIVLNGTPTTRANFRVSATNYFSQHIGDKFTISVQTSGTGAWTNFGIKTPSQDIVTSATPSNPTRTVTMAQSSTGEYICDLYINSIGTVFSNYRIKIQIEAGSTATAYERFVGNAASPNPLFPQAIYTVTGEQTVTVVEKNLFDKETATLGYRLSPTGTNYADADYFVSDYIRVGANKQCATSWTMSTYAAVCLYDADKSFLQRLTSGASFTTTATTAYVRISNLQTDIDSTQLEYGSTASSYAAYNATSYPVNLGKNLFDKNNANIIHAYINNSNAITSGPSTSTLYIPCSPNTTYTVQKSNSGTNQRFCLFTTSAEPEIGNTVLQVVGTRSGEDTSDKYTITTDNHANWLGVFFAVSDTTPSVQDIMGTIQIEVGGEKTEYSEYFAPIELLKLGDYQDYIYKSGDNWVLHKEIGYTRIDSLNDGLTHAINTNSTNTTRVLINNCLNQIPTYEPATARTLSKCNRFVYAANWSADTQGFFVDSNDAGTKNGVVFRALKSTIGVSEASVEQWLNDNPLELYYVLFNPYETVIGNEDIVAQLNTISIKSGNNSISLTSDSLLGSICVSGYTDTKAGIIDRAQNESDANANAIEEIEEELEQVHYIFPPNWSGSHGDTSIIKAYGKTIMIDSLAYGSRDDLLEWVKSNNVEHLDYFFLSHYHADHYGGIDPLVGAGIINTDTIVYLPIICNINEDWSIISHFHDLFNEKGITYVEPTIDGTTVSISDEFSIELYNLDRDWLDNSGITDGNATSMLCYIKHGDKRVLYTGDAGGKVLDRPITEGYIEGGLDLYKVEHHGINYNSTTSLPRLLLEKTQPTFSYTPANLHLLYQNNISVSITNSYLKSIGTKMYSSWNSEEQIEFVSTINSFKNLSGRPLASISNAFGTPTIYVDMNVTEADGIPDGTQEHPFRDLSQAIGYCNRTMYRATIKLADGTYNASHPDLHDKDLPRFTRLNIRIVGNTEDRTAVKIMNGFIAEDSIVDLESVTIVASGVEGCRFYRCRSVIRNCLFNSELETVTAATNGIYSEHSDIVIRDNTKFQHLNLGISTHEDSIRLSSCEFDDIDQTAVYLRNASVYVGNCSFSDTVNARFYRSANSNFQMDPVLLYSGSTTGSVITLNDNITKYNKLIVSSGIVSAGTFYSDEIRTYTSEMFGLGRTYKCNSDSGKVTLVVDESDPTKVTATAPDSLRTIYGVIEQK